MTISNTNPLTSVDHFLQKLDSKRLVEPIVQPMDTMVGHWTTGIWTTFLSGISGAWQFTSEAPDLVELTLQRLPSQIRGIEGLEEKSWLHERSAPAGNVKNNEQKRDYSVNLASAFANFKVDRFLMPQGRGPRDTTLALARLSAGSELVGRHPNISHRSNKSVSQRKGPVQLIRPVHDVELTESSLFGLNPSTMAEEVFPTNPSKTGSDHRGPRGQRVLTVQNNTEKSVHTNEYSAQADVVLAGRANERAGARQFGSRLRSTAFGIVETEPTGLVVRQVRKFLDSYERRNFGQKASATSKSPSYEATAGTLVLGNGVNAVHSDDVRTVVDGVDKGVGTFKNGARRVGLVRTGQTPGHTAGDPRVVRKHKTGTTSVGLNKTGVGLGGTGVGLGGTGVGLGMALFGRPSWGGTSFGSLIGRLGLVWPNSIRSDPERGEIERAVPGRHNPLTDNAFITLLANQSPMEITSFGKAEIANVADAGSSVYADQLALASVMGGRGGVGSGETSARHVKSWDASLLHGIRNSFRKEHLTGRKYMDITSIPLAVAQNVVVGKDSGSRGFQTGNPTGNSTSNRAGNSTGNPTGNSTGKTSERTVLIAMISGRGWTGRPMMGAEKSGRSQDNWRSRGDFDGAFSANGLFKRISRHATNSMGGSSDVGRVRLLGRLVGTGQDGYLNWRSDVGASPLESDGKDGAIRSLLTNHPGFIPSRSIDVTNLVSGLALSAHRPSYSQDHSSIRYERDSTGIERMIGGGYGRDSNENNRLQDLNNGGLEVGNFGAGDAGLGPYHRLGGSDTVRELVSLSMTAVAGTARTSMDSDHAPAQSRAASQEEQGGDDLDMAALAEEMTGRIMRRMRRERERRGQ